MTAPELSSAHRRRSVFTADGWAPEADLYRLGVIVGLAGCWSHGVVAVLTGFAFGWSLRRLRRLRGRPSTAP